MVMCGVAVCPYNKEGSYCVRRVTVLNKAGRCSQIYQKNGEFKDKRAIVAVDEEFKLKDKIIDVECREVIEPEWEQLSFDE